MKFKHDFSLCYNVTKPIPHFKISNRFQIENLKFSIYQSFELFTNQGQPRRYLIANNTQITSPKSATPSMSAAAMIMVPRTSPAASGWQFCRCQNPRPRLQSRRQNQQPNAQNSNLPFANSSLSDEVID
jgi:hypothetical protein